MDVPQIGQLPVSNAALVKQASRVQSRHSYHSFTAFLRNHTVPVRSHSLQWAKDHRCHLKKKFEIDLYVIDSWAEQLKAYCLYRWT